MKYDSRTLIEKLSPKIEVHKSEINSTQYITVAGNLYIENLNEQQVRDVTAALRYTAKTVAANVGIRIRELINQ